MESNQQSLPCYVIPFSPDPIPLDSGDALPCFDLSPWQLAPAFASISRGPDNSAPHP
jgi:hypothetical protein